MGWNAEKRPNVPLSPWAERYGLPVKYAEMNVFRRPDIQHSGFAPQHPLYYADEPDHNAPVQPQSYLELDRLFTSEQWHKFFFCTIKSWQLGPLNRFISFNGRDILPAGHMKASAVNKTIHEATFKADRIDVDENRWFPLFQKSRWFDYAQPAAELGGKRWSVDVPEIWEHMRIALELADRMLKAMIAEKHPFMELLLFGHMAMWKDIKAAAPSVMQEPFPTAIILLPLNRYRDIWKEMRARQKAANPAPPRIPQYILAGAALPGRPVRPSAVVTSHFPIGVPIRPPPRVPPYLPQGGIPIHLPPGAPINPPPRVTTPGGSFDPNTPSTPYQQGSPAPPPPDPADIFPHDRIPISDADWYTRFQQLTKDQEFCFLNDPNSSAVNGVTHLRDGGIICLNTYLLFQLMKGGLTISEQCFAYLLLARLVLHELSHAMTFVRFLERGTMFTSIPRNGPGIQQYREPFVDFGGQCEMGYALETALFGGVIRNSAFMNHDSCIPLAMHQQTWPFPTQTQETRMMGHIYTNHPDFAIGVPIYRTMIPALYASMLMSNAFWNDPNIPRKTDNFFHRTVLFYGKTPNQPGKHFSDYANEIELDVQLFDNLVVTGGSNQIWQDMVDSWRWNQNFWIERRRGWYDLERQKWLSTPWGASAEGREAIERFKLEFEKGPNTRDLYECGMWAVRLARIIDQTFCPNDYDYLLQNRPNLWYLHVIGLLMQAALPVRRENVYRPDPATPQQTIEPSSEALAAGAQARNFSLTLPNHRQDLLHKSHFADPFTAQGEDKPTPKNTDDIDQTDYLDLAMKVIANIASTRRIVSTPWLREILRMEQSLRNQRQVLTNRLPNDHILRRSMCVQWDFDTPSYEPTAMCQWDPAKGDWVVLST